MLSSERVPNQPNLSAAPILERDRTNFCFHLGMQEVELSPAQEQILNQAVRRDIPHAQRIEQLLDRSQIDQISSASDVALLLHGLSRNARDGHLDQRQLFKQHAPAIVALLSRALEFAQNPGSFSGAQLVCIAGALECLKIERASILALFASRLAENLEELDVGALAEGLRAFSRLGFVSLALFDGIGDQVAKLLREQKASPRVLSIICRSYGMSGFFPEAVSTAVARQLVMFPETFDSISLSEFARSCAIAHRRHDQALRVLTERAANKISRFSNRDLTEIGWALAILGESDAKYFGSMALELLRRGRSTDLEPPKQQDWAKAAWSLAAMQPKMGLQFLRDIGEVRQSRHNSFEDEFQFYQAEVSLNLREPGSAAKEFKAALCDLLVSDNDFQKPNLLRMRSEIRSALEKLSQDLGPEISWKERVLVDSVRVDFAGQIWGQSFALECQPYDMPLSGAKYLMSDRILGLQNVALYRIPERDWGLAPDKVNFLREMFQARREK